MTKKKKLAEEEIVSKIRHLLREGLNKDGDEVSTERQRWLKAYRGDNPWPVSSTEGRSNYVSRDVFEMVEWEAPSIMRAIHGADRALQFTPRNPEDEAKAEQETDYTKYCLYEMNNGFLVEYEWVKSTALQHVAYAKVWVEEETQITETRHRGITLEQYDALVEDPRSDSVEVVEEEARIIELPAPDPATGAIMLTPVEVYDVRVRSSRRRPRIKYATVPADQVLIDPTLTSLDLDEAEWVATRTPRTRSELIADGHDEEIIDSVGSSTGSADDNNFGSERSVRHPTTDEDPLIHPEDQAEHESMKKYWVTEISIKIDADGDGIAERRRIKLLGDVVLENEVNPYQPVVAASAIPMPNRHLGLPSADAVYDIQQLNTVLMRQLLNNLYSINVRRKWIDMTATTDPVTRAAISNPASEYVPVRGAPGNVMIQEQVTGILGEVLPVIEHVSKVRQLRTGISPEITLDPNVISEASAHAYMGALEAQSQRLELRVRLFLETALKKVYQKVHHLLRTYIDGPDMVRLRGSWVQVDPASWDERSDMTINVGLGFNGRQQTVQNLTALLALQTQQAAGMGIAPPDKVYTTLKKIVETYKCGHPEQFFIDPKSPAYKPPTPPPDPNLIIAQAEMQKAQAQAQKAQADVQLEQLRIVGEQAKMKHEQQIQAMEIGLKTVDMERIMAETANRTALETERLRSEIEHRQAQVMQTRELAVNTRALTEKVGSDMKVNEQKVELEKEKLKLEDKKLAAGAAKEKKE
jgi:hypothetical protein